MENAGSIMQNYIGVENKIFLHKRPSTRLYWKRFYKI
jgi:hypothetical protein